MDQNLKDLISRIPYSKENGFFIRGRHFRSLATACIIFGVSEEVLLARLRMGADIDTAYGGNPQRQSEKNEYNSFSKYIKPEPAVLTKVSSLTEELTIKRKGKRPQYTFKMLKSAIPHYSKQLNKLHQWVDKYSSCPGSSCFTVNALEKHWPLIINAVSHRWQFLNPAATICQTDIELIPDVTQVSYSYDVASILKQNEAIRSASIAVILVPQHILASRLQSSLGSILRSRYNQSLPTLVLINHNFLVALETYDTYLSESFMEFGKRLYDIDVNYARTL